MFQHNYWFNIAYILISLLGVHTLQLDINSRDSICAAAKEVQEGMWNYYNGFHYGGTIGTFMPPNYWWNAGEAWGGLVDYYTYCDNQNETLRQWIFDGMYSQRGEENNYVPSNQSMVEGNDDQGVFGMALMEAVEQNFQDPEDLSWIELTQALFNSMRVRWDPCTCGGGLRWQIFEWNVGYDYKSTIANGCLFHLAARLARYSDNKADYLEVAEKVWNWMVNVGYITVEDDGTTIQIYDGAHVEENCTDFTTLKWSSNYGTFLSGCAYLYNLTGDEVWKSRTLEILEASKYFFNGSIMQETTCATRGVCNYDQRSFRSIFARFLGLTMKLVPETSDTILPLLEASALGAAQSCSGGTDGITCGENWAYGGWDGVYGLGEQSSALDVLNSLLVRAPLTVNTGGSTRVNYSEEAGTENNPAIKPPEGYVLTETTCNTYSSSSTVEESSSSETSSPTTSKSSSSSSVTSTTSAKKSSSSNVSASTARFVNSTLTTSDPMSTTSEERNQGTETSQRGKSCAHRWNSNMYKLLVIAMAQI
ncbi:uncharacterized protein J8A68_002411 [[Candida] subhashii]|uniref:mannan endo-1,6-alpha-mannosidase n=1 Tax=[Candida] subhashii TaxID=561895 RepID=A0A8J5QRQ8_9ASCO|nr:uncharacterized protein J8A68_002411 [[Candida] subhashii]KAG7664087.1 hypothetical protein J8A68_002411 [[Candida] subhashii]